MRLLDSSPFLNLLPFPTGGGASDTTAPTLSSPSMASIAPDGGVPTVTTNEGNGTLYYAILTNGGSATNAQIKAGSGGNIVAGKAGSKAVTSSGVNTFPDVTLLNASTDYEVVFLQTDAAGNDSAQSEAGFTTAAPITTNFTVANLADAFFGFFDKTASHSATASWDWYSDQSTLTFYARGTACTVNLYQALANGFSYSVDDGAWTLVGGGAGFADFTVFTGLSDGDHLVRLVSSVGYNGGGAATRASGNIVAVTGAAPSVRPVGTMYHALDPSLPGQWIGLTSAAIGGSTTPAYRVPSYLVPASNPQYSYNNSNFTLRGRGTEIWIYSAVPRARYAVDDADWSDVTFPANLAERSCMRRVASGLDASTDHTYKVCGAINTAFGGKATYGMALGPYSTATYGTAPTQQKWAQFGDSITQAMNTAGQYTGFGDLFLTGQLLGFMGLHVGRSGKTAAQLDSDLGSILDGSTLADPDVSILAIGANDAGVTGESAFKTSYASCISKIQARTTTGLVLCRGITPSRGANDDQISTWISDVVTSLADPDVVYIDVSGWTGIATSDGQHPTDAGYVTMAGYEETDYAPYV